LRIIIIIITGYDDGDIEMLHMTLMHTLIN